MNSKGANGNQLQQKDSTFFKLKIDIPQSTEPVMVSTKDIWLRAKWTGPEIESDSIVSEWQFQKRNVKPNTLAGVEGRLIQDYFTTSELKLCREIWISDQNDFFAIRQRLTNGESGSINVVNMYPLALDTNDLRYSGNTYADEWEILLQKRYKNDLPQVISPQGKHQGDQFSIFQFEKRENSPKLLVGYLSWSDHLARFLLDFDNNEKQSFLRSFKAQCEFDGVILPSGGQRTSRWVMMRIGSNSNHLIQDYANRVGIHHRIKPPPGQAPSVFCTWYFMGLDYDEKFLNQDLEALEEKRIPFDVFLIDATWSFGKWGDFKSNDKWPSGMKAAANRIREAGYIPGIWTCPFLVDSSSDLAEKHPEWLLKNKDGKRSTFYMGDRDYWVLDPTYPGVSNYLEETYRKLSSDWGYEYFKLDFTRAVIVPGQQFYDSTKTRFQAYRQGMEAARKGMGPEAYLTVYGGNFEASLGIANSQQSGSDVRSMWNEKQLIRYRQHSMRSWMNRLWHAGAGAMMVRDREKEFHNNEMPLGSSEMTLGLFTDAEAQTTTLNQYINGSIVALTEFMPELGEKRRSLYKHVIPIISSRGVPLDMLNHPIPNYFRNHVEPICKSLDSWNTITIVNWGEKDMKPVVQINSETTSMLHGTQFLVFEFFSQKILGVFKLGDTLELEKLSPHHSRLIRIVPWNGKDPILAGTDLHFSGGGVEIAQWKLDTKNNIIGELETDWSYPVKITAVFPEKNMKTNSYQIRTILVHPGQKPFFILK